VKIDESVAATALVLPRVMVRVLMPPEVIGVGAKTLATVGTAALTTRLAVIGPGLLPRLVASAPGRNRVGGGAGSAAGDIGNDRTAAGRDSGTACVTDTAASRYSSFYSGTGPAQAVGVATVTPAGNVSVKIDESVAATALVLPRVMSGC